MSKTLHQDDLPRLIYAANNLLAMYIKGVENRGKEVADQEMHCLFDEIWADEQGNQTADVRVAIGNIAASEKLLEIEARKFSSNEAYLVQNCPDKTAPTFEQLLSLYRNSVVITQDLQGYFTAQCKVLSQFNEFAKLITHSDESGDLLVRYLNTRAMGHYYGEIGTLVAERQAELEGMALAAGAEVCVHQAPLVGATKLQAQMLVALELAQAGTVPYERLLALQTEQSGVKFTFSLTGAQRQPSGQAAAPFSDEEYARQLDQQWNGGVGAMPAAGRAGPAFVDGDFELALRMQTEEIGLAEQQNAERAGPAPRAVVAPAAAAPPLAAVAAVRQSWAQRAIESVAAAVIGIPPEFCEGDHRDYQSR